MFNASIGMAITLSMFNADIDIAITLSMFNDQHITWMVRADPMVFNVIAILHYGYQQRLLDLKIKIPL